MQHGITKYNHRRGPGFAASKETSQTEKKKKKKKNQFSYFREKSFSQVKLDTSAAKKDDTWLQLTEAVNRIDQGKRSPYQTT